MRPSRLLLLMLAPIAPHISESCAVASLGCSQRGVVVRSTPQRWPEFAGELIAQAEIELPIQINGKLRDVVNVPADLSEIEIEQIVMSRDKVRAQFGGQRGRPRYPGAELAGERGDQAPGVSSSIPKAISSSR